MFKQFVLAIFLFSSSTFGLLETLYQNENSCYSGCKLNYADNILNFNACKQGCDYKFQKENCADQCQSISIQKEVQASCVVGCSMSQPANDQPHGNSRLRSIIVINHRPLLRLLSSNSEPVDMMNDAIKQIKQISNLTEQSREFKTLSDVVKTLSSNIQSIKINKTRVKHIILGREDSLESFTQILKNILNKPNELTVKQLKLPIFVFLCIILISSIILFYSIISLCRKTPKHQDLSVRAQELFLEKETIPVKINLTNV